MPDILILISSPSNQLIVPSFLVWLYGDHTLELMTDSAIHRAQTAPWDETEMRAISLEDIALDNIAAEAAAMSWLSDDEENIHGHEKKLFLTLIKKNARKSTRRCARFTCRG